MSELSRPVSTEILTSCHDPCLKDGLVWTLGFKLACGLNCFMCSGVNSCLISCVILNLPALSFPRVLLSRPLFLMSPVSRQSAPCPPSSSHLCLVTLFVQYVFKVSGPLCLCQNLPCVDLVPCVPRVTSYLPRFFYFDLLFYSSNICFGLLLNKLFHLNLFEVWMICNWVHLHSSAPQTVTVTVSCPLSVTSLCQSYVEGLIRHTNPWLG